MLFALSGSMFRKPGQGISILGTNSVAILAACHPVVGDEDAVTKQLLYGVVDGPLGDQGDDNDQGPKKHVCFSSFEVHPLEDEKMYY